MIDLGPLGEQTMASTALLGVGVLTLASITFTVSRFLLSTFVLPGTSVRLRYEPAQNPGPNHTSHPSQLKHKNKHN
jgi:hypothetical protein